MEKETKEITLKTIVSIVLVIAAIVIAFFLIDHLLKGYILGEEDKYVFFKDILIINLSIMAVFFAAIVFWIQLYIKENVENSINENLKNHIKKDVKNPSVNRDKENSRYLLGSAILNDGYTIWLTYDATKKKEVLDAAIDQTRVAFTFITDLEDTDDTYLKYARAKCETKNNLGYYLAARGKFEDKAEAITCAQYIKNKLEVFPEDYAEWMDTYNYIMSKKWGLTDAGAQDLGVQDQ